MSKKVVRVSEEEARQVAEASRETSWSKPSFMREMFLGRFRLDLIHPYPLDSEPRPEFLAFFNAFREFLRDQVDSVEIDHTGEYPEHVVDGLRKLGAFGMKIPKEYGGLGFTNGEYQKIMELLGSVDGNLSALLSAHQSIGVPQPLKLFGTKEQKERFLPRCAAGEISAFALTEPEVGSDPARLLTTAEKTADGKHYVLNGEKLWCTNGTLAKLLVVMAADSASKKISAFVVETDTPGVVIEHRCHFMGLRALANAVITFTDVKIPVDNLIGKEGRGLKIALTTLNDGRLSIPNGAVGGAKKALQVVREWASERVQWGKPVGHHEAIAHKIADISGYTFAMESVAKLATAMADEGLTDIRLEAAAAKEWNTFRGWQIVDEMMQIRGGRGYETEKSLAARGEDPVGVERMMRDFRINKIFEGSSEIMHLLMAREAVDKHLEVAGDMIDPRKSPTEKLAALPKIASFYAGWYPTLWFGWKAFNPTFAQFGKLSGHLRFIERRSRKLARNIFHGMAVYPTKLEAKQGFLFRIVDVGNELLAMAASISRAHQMVEAGHPDGAQAIAIADLFCRGSRRTVDRVFYELWHNDDDYKYRMARKVLAGEHTWLEQGLLEPALPAGSEAVPVLVKTKDEEAEPAITN